MKNIFVYSTRIEITPYEEGDCEELERMCSYYDPSLHRRIPAGYCITDNKLIIPRGISLSTIERVVKNIPTICRNDENQAYMKYQYEMKSPPRDQNQERAIQFLTSNGEFAKYKKYSQFALNLETGYGKTYCMIHSLLKMKKRCIIILHQEKIKKQWISELSDKTTVRMERVLNITGSRVMNQIIDGDNDYDIFLCNHQSITSFASKYGWDKVTELFDSMSVGIKVYDEAHLCFKNILHIDFFTNVARNYYLTATFDRSDPKEVSLFKRTFSNTIRFGEDIHKRKHVIYNFVFYNSNPSKKDQVSIKTPRGVSSYLFADYAFKRDYYQTLEGVLYRVLNQTIKIEGRTAIVVPKIENVVYLEEQIKKRYENFKVGTIMSKNTEEENEYVKANCDIIITTIKSIGTGSDIKKLRNLIVAEPHSSKTVSDQLIGRLREYSETEDCYVYELIDSGFPFILNMVSRRYPRIKQKCKETVQMKA